MSTPITTPTTLRLPDLEAICKWKAAFNPHHDEVAPASDKWVLSFGLLKGRKREILREAGSGLLSSYVFPYADAEKLRTACDFVNLLFCYDEISDDQNAQDARRTGDVVISTLGDGGYDDGSLLCRMIKE